jgi:hypothetical protein
MKTSNLFETYQAIKNGLPVEPILELMKCEGSAEHIALWDRTLFSEGSKIHFDSVARNYLEQVVSTPHMVESLSWQLYVLDEIVGTILNEHKRADEICIADLGAGLGSISSWPLLSTLLRLGGARALHKAAVACYDVSMEMKLGTRALTIETVPERLRRIFDPQTPDILRQIKSGIYRIGDITEPEFVIDRGKADNHFVVTAYVFHHLSLISKFQAANCVNRMLQSDGYWLFVDEYRSFAQNLQYLDELRRDNIPWAPECFIHIQDLVDIFSRCGFRPVSPAKISEDSRWVAVILQKVERV